MPSSPRDADQFADRRHPAGVGVCVHDARGCRSKPKAPATSSAAGGRRSRPASSRSRTRPQRLPGADALHAGRARGARLQSWRGVWGAAPRRGDRSITQLATWSQTIPGRGSPGKERLDHVRRASRAGDRVAQRLAGAGPRMKVPHQGALDSPSPADDPVPPSPGRRQLEPGLSGEPVGKGNQRSEMTARAESAAGGAPVAHPLGPRHQVGQIRLAELRPMARARARRSRRE